MSDTSPEVQAAFQKDLEAFRCSDGDRNQDGVNCQKLISNTFKRCFEIAMNATSGTDAAEKIILESRKAG